jgi:hypothetical protein
MTIKFKKVLIDSGTYEAASVFDVDKNGILDIVCGAYWYEGPDFTKKHKICDIAPADEYYNDFSDIPMDVNGDGFIDIVTGAWWESTLKWRENPKGKPVEWQTIDIDKCGSIETTRPFDIDKCGIPEIFPNTPGNPGAYYKLITDKSGKGTGKFSKHVYFDQPCGHGLGVGDINNDGKQEIILTSGWLEQPTNPADLWIHHPEFNLGSASVPIIVHDVNNDGLPDLIVGHAHGYGLYWWEQRLYSNNTKRTWILHEIDTTLSQYHDMQLADIDNDGELELVTGCRYRAHCGNDPGEDTGIVGIYYFKIKAGRFEKHVIDYGKVPEATGTGIYFWLADLNNTGRLDIIAPGKDGLYLFKNLG